MAAQKKPTKPAKAPDPKILGTGGARKAADAIKNRKKQLEDALGAKKATKKKKTKYA